MAYDTYSATNSGPADQHSTLSVGDALSDCSPIHFTYPDLTAGNYSFTTQADELPAIPELDSLPAGQAEKGVFEPSCPYYNGASSGLPKFRVAEYFVEYVPPGFHRSKIGIHRSKLIECAQRLDIHWRLVRWSGFYRHRR